MLPKDIMIHALPRLTILIPLLTIFLVTGCVGIREELLSRPQTSAVNEGFSRDGKYRQGGVLIYIRPVNRIPTGVGTSWFGIDSIQRYRQEPLPASQRNTPLMPTAMSTFYIEFFIQTEQPLNIQPDQFVLTLADGTKKNAAARISPLTVYSTGNYALPLCKPAPYPAHDAVTKQPLVIRNDEPMCFIVMYDVQPPHPYDTFRVDITGIYTDQGMLRLPSITFEASQEICATP
jgi:hypothetical protein